MNQSSRSHRLKAALLGGGACCVVLGVALFFSTTLSDVSLPFALSELRTNSHTESPSAPQNGHPAIPTQRAQLKVDQLIGVPVVSAVPPFRPGHAPPWEDGRVFTLHGITYDDPTGGEVPLQWLASEADRPLTPGFRIRDFMTRDGAPLARISPRLVDGLERMRQRAGDITILSGYRHPSYNATVGGAGDSQHQAGKAADITAPSLSPAELAALALDELGCNIGLGLGATSLHVDVRGELATWTYRGAAMRGPAFAVWVLTHCGMPIPDNLARRATEMWLDESEEDSAEERLGSSRSADGVASSAATDPLAMNEGTILATAAGGFPADGPGAVVLDLRQAAVNPAARYLPAGHPEITSLGIGGLVSWCASRRDGSYFAYIILDDGREPVTGVMNLSAPPSRPRPQDRSTFSEQVAPPAARDAHETPASEWVIVVASVSDAASARRMARERRAQHANEGLEVSIAEDGGRHRIVLGPFATQGEAQRVRGTLGSRIPTDAWLLEM